jgi:uncharacterized damage-inducible protein DinB
MTVARRTILRVPGRGRSPEAASFLAQLDDLSGRMFGQLEGITPTELAWQPARGMNTIGMLLAHCAIVEVFWFALTGDEDTQDGALARVRNVLAARSDVDGMPIDRPRRLLGPEGNVRLANPRWIMFHMLEHLASHQGQMMLVRHFYRARRRK